MTSHIEGERFIIVGTLDEAVSVGEEFDRLPPHTTVLRWFRPLADAHMDRLTDLMDGLVAREEPTAFQMLRGGKRVYLGENKDVPARELVDKNKARPWYSTQFALHALVNSLGGYRNIDDPFAHTFYQHATDEPNRKVRPLVRVKVPSLALVSAHSDESTQHLVHAVDLRSEKNG